MDLITEAEHHSHAIQRAISRYGFFPEHNYPYYMHNESDYTKNVFFDFGNSRLVLAQKEEDVWHLFPNSVLAPAHERINLLYKVAEHVLIEQKAKKFVIEVDESLRRQLRMKLENAPFRARTYLYVLYWPLYNLKAWDPQLKGGRWKKLRNIKNKFTKSYRVTVKDSNDVPLEDLKQIMTAWQQHRGANDRVDDDYILSLMENKFEGMDMAKTICLDGRPCTITAGWKIPNTNNYYSSVGIIDYSVSGLGEFSNIDDLQRLKRMGFDYVDFGGSDKVLLQFKKKFKPERIYKTYTFSLVRE